MAEIDLLLIVHGSTKLIESTQLHFPIPMFIVGDLSALHRRISEGAKSGGKRVTRYFILLLDNIETEADYHYGQLEANPQVVCVFLQWNDSFRQQMNITKLYYIPTPLLTLVVSLGAVQFLKTEAEKHVKAQQTTLTKLYLRKAGSIKDWMMNAMRAQPCHVLVIPLNTTTTHLTEVLQHVREQCRNMGYPMAEVHSLDEYIPKGEIYDKLPYGKLVFEYEHPTVVCRWLRALAPIRLYLYGNEQKISHEWSKMMIADEVDSGTGGVNNDDDWHAFIEHQPIKDQIKWNFGMLFASTWKVKQYAPLLLNTLEGNIRFQSALRRAHKTYHLRMSSVSAQIFEWFDGSSDNGYLHNEFKLHRQSKVLLTPTVRTVTLQAEPSAFSPHADVKEPSVYSLPYSSNYVAEMENKYSLKSDRLFIWLDDSLFNIEERFAKIILPQRWRFLSTVDDCHSLLDKYHSQNGSRATLIARRDLAEQYFSREYSTTDISAAYLYSFGDNVASAVTHQHSVIRGVFSDLNALYDQFVYDSTTDADALTNDITENISPLCFLDAEPETFQRYRNLIDEFEKMHDEPEQTLDMANEGSDPIQSYGLPLGKAQDLIELYQSDAAIQLYTRNSNVYRSTNHALITLQQNLLNKYRVLITDLCRNLKELHQEFMDMINRSLRSKLTVYRGMRLLEDEVDRYRQNIGGIFLNRSFLSTSKSAAIALMFASGDSSAEEVPSQVPVVFRMTVDRSIKKTHPFAPIDHFSSFADEEEVLFSPGCLFRIVAVDSLSANDNIDVIHCEMVDESKFEEENPTLNIPRKISEESKHAEELRSVLTALDIQCFDTPGLETYIKSADEWQRCIVFAHEESEFLEHNEHTTMIYFTEEDTHLNDLIYLALNEIEKTRNIQTQMDRIMKMLLPSSGDFYVHLLLRSNGRQEAESQFRTKFPSSPVITFYQHEPCLTFLRSIRKDEESIGNAILILQSDETNINDIVNEFEPIDSIKYMYVCSTNASAISRRRIVHGEFQTEHDLFVRLIADHLNCSLQQMHEQVDNHKNRTEAERYLQMAKKFHLFLKEDR